MHLPVTLPDDPDVLEALYTIVVARGDYTQEQFDRLMEARLRSWGIDLRSLTAEQLIGAMQESVNQVLLNLHRALDAAPSEPLKSRFNQIIAAAHQLRDDIDRARCNAR